LGYSGWGPGQLEAEMQTGSWITVPADPTIVFDKDPSRIWADVLLTMGEEYRRYADMPFDPSFN
jgi:putative transcriptional regulator